MNSNFLHILNGLGALVGVIIAFLSYRKSQQKGSEKAIADMQGKLGEHETKIAVLEAKVDAQKQRLDDLVHSK